MNGNNALIIAASELKFKHFSWFHHPRKEKESKALLTLKGRFNIIHLLVPTPLNGVN
jgi:hypothetical protein